MTAPTAGFGEVVPQASEAQTQPPAPKVSPSDLPDASRIATVMLILLLAIVLSGLLLNLL